MQAEDWSLFVDQVINTNFLSGVVNLAYQIILYSWNFTSIITFIKMNTIKIEVF